MGGQIPRLDQRPHPPFAYPESFRSLFRGQQDHLGYCPQSTTLSQREDKVDIICRRRYILLLVVSPIDMRGQLTEKSNGSWLIRIQQRPKMGVARLVPNLSAARRWKQRKV